MTADHNEADGNTGGILSFTLPFLDVKQNADNHVDHNDVRQQQAEHVPRPQRRGLCRPARDGHPLLAADRNVVDHNQVTGNDSYGIAVANYCVAVGLSAAACAALDIEPNADGNVIAFNRALGNGTNPAPSLPSVFAVDLAWDLTGKGNCWDHDVAGTTFPPRLPACP